MSKSTTNPAGPQAKPRSSDCTGPYRIGITSSIGAGKTTIGKILQGLGVPVIDTDHLAHELLSSPNPTYNAVVLCFGNDILDTPGGPINRKKLAAIVFQPDKPELRKQLEAIMHPAIRTLTRQRVAAYDKAEAVAVLIPLLFESKLEGEYHEVWSVLIDPIEQVRRVMADATRGSQTEAQVKARIAAQMPQKEKARQSDRVIDNSGTLEDLRRQVVACVAEMKKCAQTRSQTCAGGTWKPDANAARNAEYRRILERFGALGTQEALERMGDVATTEHKEAHASMSMTVNSCEDTDGDHHHDHQHELTVDVHMKVVQKSPPPGPPGCKCGCGASCRRGCACRPDCGCECKPPVDPPKCKCGCGDSCRKTCSCKPDCGCSCKPPTPPPPPCPPTNRRGLWSFIAFLAFLFALFALIWMWPRGTDDGGGTVVTPPPVEPPPVVVTPPTVTPPSTGNCGATVTTTVEPPEFIKSNLHNQVRWRVYEWTTEYKKVCGATVTGRDGFNRVVNIQEYGANYAFLHQWIFVYDGNRVQVDRHEPNNAFSGRSIYTIDRHDRLVEANHFDEHQRPVTRARYNWSIAGNLIEVELITFDTRGGVADRQTLSPGTAMLDVLKRRFYMFDIATQGKRVL